MISANHITEWAAEHPWPTNEQIEHTGFSGRHGKLPSQRHPLHARRGVVLRSWKAVRKECSEQALANWRLHQSHPLTPTISPAS